MSIDDLVGSDDTDANGDLDADVEALDRDELEARIDILEAENERLRDRYAETRRSSYRRTAAGLAGIGATAVAGGVLFASARDVLFVLGAIGLFGGFLTYYLTPQEFIAADVAERVYDALATNETEIVADLGLSDDRVYLPDDTTATLFVPQSARDQLPSADDIEGPLVVTEQTRGLALEPSGAGLYEEFERTLSGPLADAPGEIARQVTDGLVESFELVDGTEIDLDEDDGRLTVAVDGSAYPHAFDTPPASLLGVALAVGLETPVSVETTSTDDTDMAVTCRWDVADVGAEGAADDSGDGGASDDGPEGNGERDEQ